MNRDILKPMTRIGVVILAALVGVACDDASVTPSAPIEGATWRLVSIQRGAEVVRVSAPDRYTIRFDDGRAGVRSDCNSCGGSYSRTDAELRIGPLACTRVFCGPDSLDAEFTRALDGAASALASTDTLVLHGSDATLQFSR